ncbi:hypothetical protein JCM3766R1_005962, partial [Sporobolomyces carnicolor]
MRLTRVQAKPGLAPPPSRVARVAKSLVSLYLVASIVYTFSCLVLVPAASYVSSSTSATKRQQHGSDSGVASPPRLGDLDVVAVNETSSTKNRHAALETAGVCAADVRNEDNSDPVWAAAEAAERRAKDKKNGKLAAAESDRDDGSGGYKRPDVLIDGKELTRRRQRGFEGVEWDRDQMVWHSPNSERAHARRPSSASSDSTTEGTGRTNRDDSGMVATTTTSEDHFLSLSFGSSLQPSKVIPYYYRASDPDRADFNAQDITITTLVTSNRFTVFERLVERYHGPISATVHVSDSSSHSELLRSLDKLYTSSPMMKQYVDIHLVYDSFDRQFNMWRNVAKFFARTD